VSDLCRKENLQKNFKKAPSETENNLFFNGIPKFLNPTDPYKGAVMGMLCASVFNYRGLFVIKFKSSPSPVPHHLGHRGEFLRFNISLFKNHTT